MSNFDMDWGSVKEAGTGASVDFIKLQTGQNQMRIVSKPSLVDVHWEKSVDGSTKKLTCLGRECPICKAGKVPMQRYQVKVIDRTDGKVKVLEGGTTIFNQVKNLAMDPEYGNPEMYDIKVTKSGSGRETKYSILPAPRKTELSPEESKAVEESKSLAELNKAKTPQEIAEMALECLTGVGGSDFGGATDDGDISDDDWKAL